MRAVKQCLKLAEGAVLLLVLALRLLVRLLERILDNSAQNREELSATLQDLLQVIHGSSQKASLLKVLRDKQVLDCNGGQTIRSFGEAQVGHGCILVSQRGLALLEQSE